MAKCGRQNSKYAKQRVSTPYYMIITYKKNHLGSKSPALTIYCQSRLVWTIIHAFLLINLIFHIFLSLTTWELRGRKSQDWIMHCHNSDLETNWPMILQSPTPVHTARTGYWTNGITLRSKTKYTQVKYWS